MLMHMLNELRERLGRTRRVTTPWSDDGTRGVTGAFLEELLDRWANGYDWDVHESRIGELPWVTVAAGGTKLHVIHQRSSDPGAPVVVLLHGWPDSVLRFERVLPLLTDLHVVVPALPGLPRPGGAVVPYRGRVHRGAVDAAQHARRRPRRLTRRPRGVDRREAPGLVRRVGLHAGRASYLGHRLLGHRHDRHLVRHLHRTGRHPRPDRDAGRALRVPARHQTGAAQLCRGVPERLRLCGAPCRRPLRSLGTAPGLR